MVLFRVTMDFIPTAIVKPRKESSTNQPLKYRHMLVRLVYAKLSMCLLKVIVLIIKIYQQQLLPVKSGHY